MKIGIMGTHGVGKTTRARSLHEALGGEMISGTARECPFPINQKATEEAQRWIWLTHKLREIEAAAKGGHVICDRTVLDPLVYAAVMDLNDVVDEYMPATLAWMETYDGLHWLRPVAGRLRGDGRRDPDPVFQETVDRCFGEWIKAFSIPVTEVWDGVIAP